jgi:hypothetical protein
MCSLVSPSRLPLPNSNIDNHISCVCRCNERLKVELMDLTYTGTGLWVVWGTGAPVLKIETRLVGESFECVIGECVI